MTETRSRTATRSGRPVARPVEKAPGSLPGYALLMFKRIWWFAVGLIAGLGGSAWAMARVSQARQALTPANLRRTAALSVADALEGAGSRLRSPNGQG